MTQIGQDLVRRLVTEELQRRPRLHDDYLHDADAHAAVKQGWEVLVAVADSMQTARVPFDLAEQVLRETVGRILDGVERDVMARAAATSLPPVGGVWSWMI